MVVRRHRGQALPLKVLAERIAAPKALVAGLKEIIPKGDHAAENRTPSGVPA
jgi:hypothetical protein